MKDADDIKPFSEMIKNENPDNCHMGISKDHNSKGKGSKPYKETGVSLHKAALATAEREISKVMEDME